MGDGMVADIPGDRREELITVLPGEMRIYSTTIPAIDRRVCLMQDPFCRSQVTYRSMRYEQSPVKSYYLGNKFNGLTSNLFFRRYLNNHL